MISFVIPNRNCEHYLAECLNSLVHQSSKDVEIIVVDDFSTDNSLRLLEYYTKKFPKITYYKNQIRGRANARQLGAEATKGQIICFQDADDFAHKDRAVATKSMLTDKDILVSAAMMVNQVNTPLGPLPTKFNFKRFKESLTLGIVEPFMAGRREHVLDIGFDEKFGKLGLELWHFFLEAYARRLKIRYSKKILGYYRSHDGNTSRGRDKDAVISAKKAYLEGRLEDLIRSDTKYRSRFLPNAQLCEHSDKVQPGNGSNGGAERGGTQRVREVAGSPQDAS